MSIRNLLSVFAFITLIFSSHFIHAKSAYDYKENLDFFRAQKLMEEQKFSDANKIFGQIVANYQDSSIVPYAKILQAYCQYNLGKYKFALEFLQDFIETYPKNPNLEYAHYLKMLSHVYYMTDSSSLAAYFSRSEQVEQAIELAEDFLFEFPNSIYYSEMKDKLDFINDYALKHKLNDKATIVSPEESFLKGQKALNRKIKQVRGKYRKVGPDYATAAKEFDKIYLEHPGSSITKYAEIMQAYSLYMDGKYLDAIDVLDTFIELHPSDENLEYAYYLKILAHINETDDIELGQDHSKEAVNAISALLENFPNTKYAKTAKEKLALARNYLAGNSVIVGNFYTKQSNPIAALRRYDEVISTYNDSIYYTEALYRSFICYKMLGLNQEAERLENLLKTKYKENYWTQILSYQFPHKEKALKPKDLKNSKQISSVKK
ncbi:MAG: outer membrane protein assembly factor BamD [Rickettsiaceae bacterium]|nr:outer membrane protein assembly factor BamD [Rickettsiaceae bacterium]